MAQIIQTYPLIPTPTIIDSAKLQFDLNQLFTTVNTLDADNLSKPASKFDWKNTKLINVITASGSVSSATDAKVALTKEYLQNEIFATGKILDPAAGDWHKHANKAKLDLITSAGSGQIITVVERSHLPTGDEKDAMDGANAPTAANVFATMSDVTGVVAACEDVFIDAFNAALGNGLSLTTASIDLTSHPHLIVRIEAECFGAGPDHQGAVDVVVNRRSTDLIFVEVLKMQASNAPVITVDYPYPSLALSAAAEGSRNVWTTPVGLTLVARLIGPLIDATPVQIGEASIAAGATSPIFISKVAGSKAVVFIVTNGTGVVAASKISIFGHKR